MSLTGGKKRKADSSASAHLSGLKADGLQGCKGQVAPVGELSEAADDAGKHKHGNRIHLTYNIEQHPGRHQRAVSIGSAGGRLTLSRWAPSRGRRVRRKRAQSSNRRTFQLLPPTSLETQKKQNERISRRSKSGVSFCLHDCI